MQEGGGHFQNGGCLRMYYTVLRMAPFSRCNIVDRLFFFINKWIFYMFRMHVSGNHKVEKYSRYVIWYAPAPRVLKHPPFWKCTLLLVYVSHWYKLYYISGILF